MEAHENIIPNGKGGSHSHAGLPPAVDLILREIANQVQRLAMAQSEQTIDSRRSSQQMAGKTVEDLSKALRAVADNLEAGLTQTHGSITSLAHNETQQKSLVDAMFEHMNALVQAQGQLSNAKKCCSNSLQKAGKQGEKSRAVLCIAQNLSSSAKRLEVETSSLGELFNSCLSFANSAQKLQGNLVLGSQKAKKCLTPLREAASRSVCAAETAKKEFAQISEMVSAIASTIDLINSISEQTNILSLNLSIESARAGEQGQGFTIIAEELRRLSERSITSTAETLSKITRIDEDNRAAMSVLQDSCESLRMAIAFADETEGHIVKIRDDASQMSKIALGINDQLRTGRNLCHAALNQSRLIFKNSNEVLESTQFITDLFKQDNSSLHGFMSDIQDIEKRIQVEIKASEAMFFQQQDLENKTSRAYDISLKLNFALLAAQLESQSALALAEHTTTTLVDQTLSKDEQLSEIKEQLSQCAQEILKLVDNPSEPRMVS